MNLLSRLRGGIYGTAVGDALGATVEFMSRNQIRTAYGIHKDITGGGWLGLQPGEFTDDTEMTLAVAEGLKANPDNPVPEVGLRFVRWFESKPKDVGNIIRSSINNFLALGEWSSAARRSHAEMGGRSAGNGSLMRTLPVTFAYLNDQEKMIKTAMIISGMTHHDPEAGICCAIYNELLRLIVKSYLEKNKHDLVKEAVQKIKNELSVHVGSSLPPNFWEKIIDAGTLKEDQVKASGYVLDSLVATLWSFLTTDSFEEAIIQAVNLGDDADTVGAICGGLAGTLYGFEAIPDRWLNTLKNKERLESATTKLFKG